MREVVGEDAALEVVVFVLDDAGQDAVEVAVVVFTVLVVVGDVDVGLADDVLVDFRETEATFGEGNIVAETVGNGGVDEGSLEGLVVGIDLFVGGGIDHEDAHGLTHLRGGEPYALGVVHGLEKVVDERLQRFILEIDFRGGLPQHGVSV